MEVVVPEIAENVERAEVLELFVGVGEHVEAEQRMLEIEADKASFELPSPAAGEVREIHVEVGDEVEVGDLVITLQADEEGSEDTNQAEEAEEREGEEREGEEREGEEREAEEREAEEREGEEQEAGEAEVEAQRKAERDAPEPTSLAARSSQPGEIPVRASPAVRRRARERGLDLQTLAAEAEGARITVAQVDAHASGELDSEAARFSKFGEVELVRLGRRRRLIAARMAEAWRTIPHVTQHDDLDITELDAARRRDDGPGILAFAVKACALALREHPRVNSSLVDGGHQLVLKRYINIGVAVDTEAGLVVPVLERADQRPIDALAAALEQLAAAARQRSLSREQLDGASFTITNLGGFGGTHFTPIINPPQVAILGVCRAFERDGRGLLPVSLSYDHRVLDGADAMRFLNTLAELLGSPLALLRRA